MLHKEFSQYYSSAIQQTNKQKSSVQPKTTLTNYKGLHLKPRRTNH